VVNNAATEIRPPRWVNFRWKPWVSFAWKSTTGWEIWNKHTYGGHL